jgi:hypothetical protein
MHGFLISPHVLDCHKTSAKWLLHNWRDRYIPLVVYFFRLARGLNNIKP